MLTSAALAAGKWAKNEGVDIINSTFRGNSAVNVNGGVLSHEPIDCSCTARALRFGLQMCHICCMDIKMHSALLGMGNAYDHSTMHPMEHVMHVDPSIYRMTTSEL